MHGQIYEGTCSQPWPNEEEAPTQRLGTWDEGEEGLNPIQRTESILLDENTWSLWRKRVCTGVHVTCLGDTPVSTFSLLLENRTVQYHWSL